MKVTIKIGEGFGIFLAVLQAGLILLKIAKVITWPWVLVFAPAWGSVIVSTLLALLIMFIYVLIYDNDRRQR